MSTIRFNTKAQRFINEKGQFIQEQKVIETLDKYRIQRSVKIEKIVARHLDSEPPNYEKLMIETAKELKNLWFVNYVVGKGGVKQMTNDDIDLLNSELSRELTVSFDPINGRAYGLQELVTQHELGEISSKELTARIKAYVRGSRKGYWQAVDSRQTQPYMRRFLHGDNNCPECIEYAAIGMVKKDGLPLPGQLCSCRSNCNCSVKYYSEKQYKQYLRQQLSSFADTILSK